MNDKFDTIRLGNELAEQIKAKGPRPNYSATLRHTLAKSGVNDATALACQLLGINHTDACTVIARLSKSKPDDIWTPHDLDRLG